MTNETATKVQEMLKKAKELRERANACGDDWEDLICEACDLERDAANLKAGPAFHKPFIFPD